MYPINFMTCSADDVIARSVTCHPSLLAEGMRQRAKAHIDAHLAMLPRDAYAAKVAQGMADDCYLISHRLEDGKGLGQLTFGQKIMLYSLAAKLQCLTHSQAQDILSRTDTQSWANS